MTLAAGTRLGPYQILAPLGAGGMGEVYRARDTKLKRDVALKVLPEAFAQDPARMARFQREAEVLASLNHPNIAQIYGAEDRALIMELVEGETLKGPLPLETALNYAKHIADALDAAHEKGIVHRDLKPANVMITPAGSVKLLDFGLAAVLQGPVPSAGDPDNSPTITMGPTQAGMIMGTAAYMSPEQASGKTVDKRADIWSFGVVLFEMLTGRRLFDGETVSHTLADVLKGPIDLARLPKETPAPIRELLGRCLDRDVKNRLRDIGEARVAIGKYLADPRGGTEVPRQAKTPALLAVAAVFALAAIGLGYVAYRHATEPAPQVLRFTVPRPDKGTFSPNGLPAISPDGRHIAYVARVDGKNELSVRDLDSLTSRPLITENVRFPFWSRDSRAIGFFSGGKLKRVDAAGGPALTLCDAPNGVGGTWNQNDAILFTPSVGSPILRVTAAGGTPTPVTTVDKGSNESGHFLPWFLPDGRHFFYTAATSDEEQSAIYIADLDSKERRRVMFAKSNAVYASPGYILFLRERTLMAQSFDAGKLQTTGDAFPLAAQVDVPGRNAGEFSASQNGVLTYTAGALSQNVQLTWYDRSGKSQGTVADPGETQWSAISADGQAIAFDRRDAQTRYFDIWVHDMARGTDSRFTFNSKNNEFPVWSPDGKTIAFLSDRGGHGNVYRKATGGAAQDEVVDNGELTKRPTDWSADGRYLFEETNAATPKTGDDIWVAPIAPEGGGSKPYPYLRTEFAEGPAKLSPNGKWLAYPSNETKRDEVYVMTFPNPGGKWQISTSGGNIPVWSRDGKELFFISADNKMMAVEIKGTGSNPEAGVPKALFDVRLGPNNPGFDVANGGGFLVPTAVEQTASAPINVVVNWTAGLKK